MKYDLVWETIKVVIPEIKPMIAKVQADLEEEHVKDK